jgi:hypothetical protein
MTGRIPDDPVDGAADDVGGWAEVDGNAVGFTVGDDCTGDG